MIQEILLSKIHPHPDNPRKDAWDEGSFTELKNSISEMGIINNPIIREFNTADIDGGPPFYQIISGHRRIEAARELGHVTVPCNVRLLTNDQALFLLMCDNMFREDLNPLEEAEGYQMLGDQLGLDSEKIASALGVREKTVKRKQALLDLPIDVKERIADRTVSLDVADLLVRLPAELKEEGCEIIMFQLELGGVNKTQAHDLLKHDLIDPLEKEKAWKEKEEDRIREAYVSAKNRSRVELEDPLLKYGNFKDILTSKHREALSSVDIRERAEDQDSSLLWLHLAQRHNVPITLIPHRADSYLLIVDSALILEAETAISDGIKDGHRLLKDPDSSDSLRAQAQTLTEQEIWLNISPSSTTETPTPENPLTPQESAENPEPTPPTPDQENTLPSLEDYIKEVIEEKRKLLRGFEEKEEKGEFLSYEEEITYTMNIDFLNILKVILSQKSKKWA